MASTSGRARARRPGAPGRSPKAGRPPREPESPPRVRRRQRRAQVALRTGTTLRQTAEGPRVVWAVTKPKVKKR
jgi:hypothetical protein